MRTPVVLIGPMGVGKTTIGKKLAKTLAVPFLDTDQEVSRSHGPIPKLFEQYGEPHFRALETEALVSCLDRGGVVATGGGIVLEEKNRKALKHGFVIYLSTNGKHIAARLVGGGRPLLKNGTADWREIYEKRKPLYESVADVEISTSGKPLGKIVDEIVGLVTKDD